MLLLLSLFACAAEAVVACSCGDGLLVSETSCADAELTPEDFAAELEELQSALCQASDPDCSCACAVR